MSAGSNRIRVHALSAATALALASLAAPAFAGQVNLAGLQSTPSNDRFIVKYRAGTPEQADVARVRAKLSQKSSAGGKAVALGHVRRMALGADEYEGGRR